jgi:hypothetical protein
MAVLDGIMYFKGISRGFYRAEYGRIRVVGVSERVRNTLPASELFELF